MINLGDCGQAVPLRLYQPFNLVVANEGKMPTVEVDLGDRSYTISIEAGALARLGEVVATARPTAVLLVSNPVVAGHYGEAALNSLQNAGLRSELMCLPAGERFKTLNSVKKIYDALLQSHIDRKGAVVALGGGVIGDMAGFAAASYLRGVDFYQVPTTLLAQVDASVGGKVGVDLPQGKNLVGAFHQPKAVVVDTSTLRTLPARELRSGLAEVVKHGIIYDQDFLIFLNQNAARLLSRSEAEMVRAVRRSVEIKRDIVVNDERESGIRAILNYGHTIGHAIEVLSGYGRYRHGEAVAIGMVTEAILAELEGIAPKGTAGIVAESLIQMRLPADIDASLPTERVIRAIELDKKTLGGVLRLALPVEVGKCSVAEVSREALTAAIEAHKARRFQK